MLAGLGRKLLPRGKVGEKTLDHRVNGRSRRLGEGEGVHTTGIGLVFDLRLRGRFNLGKLCRLGLVRRGSRGGICFKRKESCRQNYQDRHHGHSLEPIIASRPAIGWVAGPNIPR